MKTYSEITLTEKERGILKRIRETVRGVLPDATVIFFGSRARGDAREYSDWDILILTDKVTHEIEHEAYAALYDVELDEDIIICPLILQRDEWEHKRYREHPIHERVDEEGVLV